MMSERCDINDHIPFLAAILCQLGEALPCLVYADWLEEQGEETAEWWRGLAAGMQVIRQPFDWHPHEVELTRTGYHHPAYTLTLQGIDEMVANFRRNFIRTVAIEVRNGTPQLQSVRIDIPVAASHWDDAPRLGRILWLWRRGERLMGVLEGPYIERTQRGDLHPNLEMLTRDEEVSPSRFLPDREITVTLMPTKE